MTSGAERRRRLLGDEAIAEADRLALDAPPMSPRVRASLLALLGVEGFARLTGTPLPPLPPRQTTEERDYSIVDSPLGADQQGELITGQVLTDHLDEIERLTGVRPPAPESEREADESRRMAKREQQG